MATSTSPSLVLTNPNTEQLERQFFLNGQSWRGALSMEAYLRRERYLATRGIADKDGLTYWVLVDSNTPTDQQEALAGCETLRKRALISQDGQVRDAHAFGVASVFTPPAFRGNSYASRMVRELPRSVQAKDPSTQYDFSILYSDIGPKFYAREGWEVHPSAHIHLPPKAEEASSESETASAVPLRAEDLPALCLADEAAIRARLARLEGVAVALIADHSTIVWHHSREEFVANELHGRTPTIKGAMVHEGSLRVWAIWSRVFLNPDPQSSKDNTLHILRLVVEDGRTGEARDDQAVTDAITAIFRMAQREAHEWHMQEVELWNPEARSVLAAHRLDPKVEIVQRDAESIASLKWLGDPVGEAEITWTENEKCGWC